MAKPKENPDAWKDAIEDGGAMDGSGARYPLLQSVIEKQTGKCVLVRSDGEDKIVNAYGTEMDGVTVVSAPLLGCLITARRRWEIRDPADKLVAFRAFDGPRSEKRDFERFKMRVQVLALITMGDDFETLCLTSGGQVANDAWRLLDGPRHAAQIAAKATGKMAGSAPWTVKIEPFAQTVMVKEKGGEKPRDVAAFRDMIPEKAEPGARWHDTLSRAAQAIARSPEIVAWRDEWKHVEAPTQGD